VQEGAGYRPREVTASRKWRPSARSPNDKCVLLGSIECSGERASPGGPNGKSISFRKRAVLFDRFERPSLIIPVRSYRPAARVRTSILLSRASRHHRCHQCRVKESPARVIHARACMYMCVCVCVRACARARACVCVYIYIYVVYLSSFAARAANVAARTYISQTLRGVKETSLGAAPRKIFPEGAYMGLLRRRGIWMNTFSPK